ncbi:hypothetical protein M752DRAFT_46313 [Aspergillus phoenicis ATCC 13157]|uniref:Uncharacterized protein n=2 Tax=Aspergillus TaxID=5052 RepID=A0A370PCP7_ASPPH|nr:hypothetical protein M747DRAFT_39106 [Aspergillus niger ATCC 13496]RDK39965.1 hypothetical protein M752DRAFT_46313 [Aspergillus phoenicis ATCC 13157]
MDVWISVLLLLVLYICHVFLLLRADHLPIFPLVVFLSVSDVLATYLMCIYTLHY